LLHPQARHAPLKARTIRGIAISEEVLRGRIPRKGLDELLGRPLGGRVCGHVEMNHFPPCVRKDDQHEEHLEPDRGDGEEIERDELRQVILQEGPPGGRGRLSRADAILLDRGFRHRNPELPQFAENPRGPPLRISRGDLPDQCPDFLADRWSARVPPAEAGPVVPKTLTLPGEHGRWLHEDQGFPPASPMPRQPRPEDSVTAPHPRPPDRSFVNRELMPKRHDLHLEGHARAEQARDEREQCTADGHHAAESFRRRGEYPRRAA